MLSFQASEAFNFATFGFEVVKATSSIIDLGGYVFDNPAPGIPYTPTPPPFYLSGGTYTSSGETVGDLLGTCIRAAYAESLTVKHLATNGTSPLWQTYALPYYASSLVAFALAND